MENNTFVDLFGLRRKHLGTRYSLALDISLFWPSLCLCSVYPVLIWSSVAVCSLQLQVKALWNHKGHEHPWSAAAGTLGWEGEITELSCWINRMVQPNRKRLPQTLMEDLDCLCLSFWSLLLQREKSLFSEYLTNPVFFLAICHCVVPPKMSESLLSLQGLN